MHPNNSLHLEMPNDRRAVMISLIIAVLSTTAALALLLSTNFFKRTRPDAFPLLDPPLRQPPNDGREPPQFASLSSAR